MIYLFYFGIFYMIDLINGVPFREEKKLISDNVFTY